MRAIRHVVIGIAITSLLLASAGWFVVVLLCRPQTHAIAAAPPDLRSEDVVFTTADGVAVRGWLMRGTPGCGSVALLHGVHADRTAMVDRARWLSQAGYTVLLFDFRAHGESDGDAITFGLRESMDARAAIALLRSRAPGERIGAIGTSMGGAAAILARPRLLIDALQLEQVYPTIDAALEARLRAYLGWPGSWLAPLLRVEAEWRLGIDADQLRPIDHISDVGTPVSIFAGEVDTRTPLEQSQALFAAAHEPKQFWSVPGAGHVDLAAFAGNDYRMRTLAFLSAHLRDSPSCRSR